MITFRHPSEDTSFSQGMLMMIVRELLLTYIYSQPPPTITRSFLPVISAGSSPYRRRVVLEYVSKYLLPNFGGQMSSPLPSDQLKRLQIEFMIQDDGDLELERVMGEYNRSTIDIIGLEK